MLDKKHLRQVPLPSGLTPAAIFEAMQKTQDFFALIRKKTQINLSQIIQSNNFSGVVSNVFTKHLNDVSPYKIFHDQRYPDLKHTKLGIGLEVKASNKPMKGGEGHNGHSGWHVIVCFETQQNGDIEFVQVEIADLIGFEHEDSSDWKYQGSQRNENASQRTETYTTTAIGTAKLRDGSVFLNTNKCPITPQKIAMRAKVAIPIPPFSPFAQK
ncbi:MAG: hypothetical protein ACRC46_06610 [Thermoguttaceae bacterium]